MQSRSRQSGSRQLLPCYVDLKNLSNLVFGMNCAVGFLGPAGQCFLWYRSPIPHSSLFPHIFPTRKRFFMRQSRRRLPMASGLRRFSVGWILADIEAAGDGVVVDWRSKRG